MKKNSLRKPDLLSVRPRWGTKNSLFCKGFTELQTAVFEGDDESIIAVQNEVLTGNKTAGAIKQKKVYNFLSL